ncbi:MAG: glycoside hydrolase family 15 protein [Acidobacteriaceae bacterium]|jgi:glucoamylase
MGDVTTYQWLNDDGPAFGWPGVAPTWTSSEKDAVSTAYSASSRVWFTVSHGTLNELYYPTIDRPQTRDMEFLFTDGENFFHEEKRDIKYAFSYVDPDAPAVKVVGKDPMGRYTVTKEIVSDPHHSVVLMNVKITGDECVLERLKCYALLAPHLHGGGAGNSARSVLVAGQRALLAWHGPVSLAMGADCGFTRSSCGFVGASDGYQDLLADLKMTWNFGEALNGNIAIMGEIEVARTREFTIAIGLGDGHHAALSEMMQALAMPYEVHCARFVEQWMRVMTPKELGASSTDGGRLSRISQNVILTHEDKTYSGAFIASASIPWGASKGDDDLGGYHLVWTRDMVQSASALMACGRCETALRALVYLACTQHPDGSFAQNFWIDGTPYWTGIQLDEVASPIVLAWRLWKQKSLEKFDVFPFVERAAGFIVRYAPITQQERWEEAAGYSPSTLAAVITALVCAADIARGHQAEELAGFLEDYADWIEAHLDEWTTTNDGVLLPEVKRHYMRIRPPCAGEPFHNPAIPEGHLVLANRAPGEQSCFEAREIIDAGFLELVRYGIRRADDPLIVDSLKVVDHVLKRDTSNGPCWRRYNHDGYGQRKDGGPYMGWGQGRAWPLLSGERGHYELVAGRDAKAFIAAMEKFASFGGMLPEQVWDQDDVPELELFSGKSSGAAQPLVWAHSEYLKLLRSTADGQVFDCLSCVKDRYGVAPGTRTFRNNLEIFQTSRPVKALAAGMTLRVVDTVRFRVVYSMDGWKTNATMESKPVGYAGFYADLATAAGWAGEIAFTFYWPGQDKWLGRNFEVVVG